MISNLDMRPMGVLLLLSALLMAVILWPGSRGSRNDGRRKWIAGLVLVALGWFMVTTREVLPPLFSVALADALLLAGLCAQVAALLEFGGRRPSRLLAAPAPLLLLALVPVRHDLAASTLVAGPALAGVLLAMALLSRKLGCGAARWPMALFYLFGAVLSAARAVVVWFAPDTQVGILRPDALNSIAFVTLFAMTLTGTFGFLEMQRQRIEAEIRCLAMFDGVTGLLNRHAFLELAERELSRAKRIGLSFAVLMFDIDHFKRVNDRSGHSAGDRVLAAVAAASRGSLRREDLLGRYGGEEFCVLLPGTHLRQAVAVGERIREAVARLALDGMPAAVTVSIGVTLSHEVGPAAVADAIDRAGQALLHAKNTGRNRVIAFEAVSPVRAGGLRVVAQPAGGFT